MTVIAVAALFAVGVYAAMRTLAALHHAIDFWYAVHRLWTRVVRDIAGWTAATATAAFVLPHWLRAAFVWGFAAYVVFYVAVAIILSRVVMPRAGARVGAA